MTVLSDSAFQDQVTDVAAFLSRSKPEAERTQYIESWSSKASGEASDRDAVTQELFAEVKGLGDGLERGELRMHTSEVRVQTLTEAIASVS